MTDLEGTRLEDATEMTRAALAADPGTVEIEGGGSGLTYAAFPLKGGGACDLVSEYLPQWVSARPRRPASQPAEPHARRRRCGKRARARARGAPCELRHLAQDGAARGGGGARRRGRARLRGRQHQRERGERRPRRDGRHADLPRRVARGPLGRGAGQREQVASLAHDLKTPLTVLRANADFVAEELEDQKDATSPAAARDIAGSVERLDGYVRLLI